MYGWYVRNRDGLFMRLNASRGYYGLGFSIVWMPYRAGADRFDKWEHGRDFLKWLYAEPYIAEDDSLHLIDYAEHLPATPDADTPPVRTAAKVRADAMAEDKAREAIRRANWCIKAREEARGVLGIQMFKKG